MVNEQNTAVEVLESESGKVEREIPEEILKKVFKDLYPATMHKTKYIQDNPSLKMPAMAKGILVKNPKKEDVDDFLVKQVPKNPKSMKQLGVDWFDSKKSMKIDAEKLSSDSLSVEDVKKMIEDNNMEDFEAYIYLMQSEISDTVFNFVKEIKEETIKKQIESGVFDPEKVKELEAKIKEYETKIVELQNAQKDEINNIKQNYEIEKEKLKNKNEQKMETFKSKYEEEKAQLIKIQADSDRRFSDERKTYTEQIETLERDNKKYLERINSIGSDLMSQNKQNKDTNKSINRIQNRIDELQADNKELTLKNEELKASYENISSQMIKYKKQEFALQHKVQELALKLQELEKAKIGFLLTEAEIKNIIRELNAVDETKERMLQIVNIDSRKTESNEAKRLDQLWVKLIEQEEEVISEYLSIALEDVITTPEVLQDKIDSLLDIELNLKAREVLVKMLYEKGYKANKLLG